MTSDEEKKTLLINLKSSLIDLAFRDIYKASLGGSKMGAFILASCYIDYLTGFFIGGDSAKRAYIEFITTYMPKYDGTKLYEDMRCKLVHNYSEGGSYIFTDSRRELHFLKRDDGRVILNLEDFLDDIHGATMKLFKEIENDSNRFTLALNRFISIGLLQIQHEVKLQ